MSFGPAENFVVYYILQLFKDTQIYLTVRSTAAGKISLYFAGEEQII